LLAHITISKFVDHLPFYRQSKMFAREGLRIPDSTLGGWFSEACKWMFFVYDELKQQILSGDYLQADETPIPVLSKDKARIHP
jgi:transposase